MSDFEAQSRDRALGALLGLAVGDALGTTLEFSPRDSQPHHSEMIGQGRSTSRLGFGPMTPRWPWPWPIIFWRMAISIRPI